MVATVAAVGFAGARAVLFPRINSPGRVDAIIVVAGAADNRYVYASHLAKEGVAVQVLVSQPSPAGSSTFATAIEDY